MKSLTLICDLQFGSTGKGLIAGYLANKNGYDTIVNANMPNAGHTFIDKTGRKWIHKVLPNGIVCSPKKVMIGPGSVFSLGVLEREIRDSLDLLEHTRILIHPDACVVHKEHRIAEQAILVESIGSTGQGSAAAMVQKIARDSKRDPRVSAATLTGFIKYHTEILPQAEWLRQMKSSGHVLVEGAQGYSLGISAGFWPYCTSRECTPARILSDSGVPLNDKIRVIGVARVHPIRVGGNSGPWYKDQEQISWGSLGVPPEKTTVTQRDRRIATFSRKQTVHALQACCPDDIFLNFCNYNEKDSIRAYDILSEKGKVSWLGYGPCESDIVKV